MKADYTPLFIRYREVARLVWNLGFWPDPELRTVQSILAFEDAMARLFEGMILLHVGCGGRVERWPSGLGEPANFRIAINAPEVELRVDRYLPGGSHEWGTPTLKILPDSCSLRFHCFMNWDQSGPRDYRLIQVLIERFDERPDVVGRLALLELDKCEIWFDDEDRGAQPRKESWL
jgi:hypothetical protein